MEKNYLTGADINELIRASSTLKPGEVVTGYIGEQKRRKDYGTVIVSVYNVESRTTLGKQLKEKTPEEPTKTSLQKKFHLVKCSICKFLATALDKIEDLSAREDDLDKIYQDSKGRDYYINEDDLKIYLDSRGFEYFIKYIPDFGREFYYMKLYDEYGNMTLATFIDEERTMLQVNGKVYPMDINGNILYDEEVPYLGPRL